MFKRGNTKYQHKHSSSGGKMKQDFFWLYASIDDIIDIEPYTNEVDKSNDGTDVTPIFNDSAESSSEHTE